MIKVARYVNVESGMMLTTEHNGGLLVGLVGKTVKTEVCEMDTVRIEQEYYKVIGTYGRLSQVERLDDEFPAEDEDMLAHTESLDAIFASEDRDEQLESLESIREQSYEMEDELIDAIDFDDFWDRRPDRRDLIRSLGFRRIGDDR